MYHGSNSVSCIDLIEIFGIEHFEIPLIRTVVSSGSAASSEWEASGELLARPFGKAQMEGKFTDGLSILTGIFCSSQKI